MTVTYETKIGDKSLYLQLQTYADLYGNLERKLFRDLFVKHLPVNDLKRHYIAGEGITARQFNSLRIGLEGKIASAKEALILKHQTLTDKLKAVQRTIIELEQKLDRPTAQNQAAKSEGVNSNQPVAPAIVAKAKLCFKLHQKKRKLYTLQKRLERTKTQLARSVPRICFGNNKLFRKQFQLTTNGYASHAEWKEAWEQARHNQFYCVGSGDETGGNQSCTLIGHSLRLRLPTKLIISAADKYLTIPNIGFKYGQAVVEQAIWEGQPLTYRFIRREQTSRSGKSDKGYAWYVQVSLVRPPAPIITSSLLGAIGLDFNPALIALARIDRYGNPVYTHHYPVQLEDRSSPQVTATLGDAIATIVEYAQKQAVPIVIEKLDFAKKKAILGETSPKYARMLSSFAYKKFHSMLHSRAARYGVAIKEVNPAYTSVIGLIKFKTGYGISTHASAAIAIARRGMNFSEKLSTRSKQLTAGNTAKTAFSLPVRNRMKHVWSDWAIARGLLRSLRNKERSIEPSQQDSSGRLVSLSTRTGVYPLLM